MIARKRWSWKAGDLHRELASPRTCCPAPGSQVDLAKGSHHSRSILQPKELRTVPPSTIAWITFERSRRRVGRVGSDKFSSSECRFVAVRQYRFLSFNIKATTRATSPPTGRAPARFGRAI